MTSSLVRTLSAAGAAACWATLVLAWTAGALYNASRGSSRRARRRSGSAGFIAAVIVVALVVSATVKLVPASTWRAATVRTPSVEVLGSGILISSTALALWARFTLGRMWSLAPMIKERHELRTDGPYGVTRHPIYTGLLGMLLGTMLVVGLGRSLLIFPVGVVVLGIKIRMEEALLLASFPDAYPPYQRRVPRLVPSLRPLRRRPTADG
jgi:protein-S-isoprenylcysteine O-methyltransferase Ste14